MQDIQLTIFPGRVGTASGYVGGLTVERYVFELPQSFSGQPHVEVLSRDGVRLAAADAAWDALRLAWAAEVDTNTQSVQAAFEGRPADAELAVQIFVGTADDILAVVPATMRKNWADEGGSFPPVPAPEYWTKAQVQAALALKQDKLTAGQGINIDDNVISSTGGGNATLTAQPTAVSVKNAAGEGILVWDAQTQNPLVEFYYLDAATAQLLVRRLAFATKNDLGKKQNAPNTPSTSYGFVAAASTEATAIGFSSSAASQAAAVGTNSTAAAHAVAAGRYARAVSEFAVAVGDASAARGHSSLALGAAAETGTNPSGATGSIALGAAARVGEHDGIAIGPETTSDAPEAAAAGLDAHNAEPCSWLSMARNSQAGTALGLRLVAGPTPETSFLQLIHHDVVSGDVVGWSIRADEFGNIFLGAPTPDLPNGRIGGGSGGGSGSGSGSASGGLI